MLVATIARLIDFRAVGISLGSALVSSTRQVEHIATDASNPEVDRPLE
jgi:hypothetical protein